MPVTSDGRLPLGTLAPNFTLPEVVSGAHVHLRDLIGNSALVVTFICNHCPYVKHVEPELVRLAADYEPRGVAFVAISSNDPARYPDDGPAGLREQALRAGFTFPYLFDETQDVARTYTAACTPDTFLFDAHGKLAYRGQLDDTRPSSGRPADGRDLRSALDAVLAGNPVQAEQKPSVGCGIKWKAEQPTP